jgi:hypothetical protein
MLCPFPEMWHGVYFFNHAGFYYLMARKNLKEICSKLYIKEDSCLKAIQRGKLPGKKISGKWVVEEKDVKKYFRGMDLKYWISQTDVLDIFHVSEKELEMAFGFAAFGRSSVMLLRTN